MFIDYSQGSSSCAFHTVDYQSGMVLYYLLCWVPVGTMFCIQLFKKEIKCSIEEQHYS